MEHTRGKNAKNVRSENRGLLFRHLCTNGRTSRVELTQLSGLTKMTITNIISEFLDSKLVAEDIKEKSGKRNNPIELHLSPDAPKVIALLIRHSYLSVALCDLNLEILALESVKLNDCTETTLVQSAMTLTNHMMAYGNILGIGIGTIGPVDIHNGVILNPPHFHGIQNLHIKELFEEAYELPVEVDYHYNCAALAEKYYGYGKKYSNFLYVGISDGLSMGIITNNQLFSSFTGYASEFGHLCVNFDDSETPCDCANQGCLGGYVFFDRDHPEQNEQNIHTLSVSLAGLCNILNPQAIIIDNSYGICSDKLLDYLSHDLNERIVLHQYRHIDVLKSYRGDNFETASCAINIIHQVFEGKLLF